MPRNDPVRLRVTEIFLSLQGEARDAGRPTVFVRLTGCPLRCAYCDTAYAFTGGRWMALDEILRVVADHGVEPVCVTGGEPLAQRHCPALLLALCEAGHAVSLETSGALDVSSLDPRVTKVMDLKTPASGEAHRNRWENLEHLSPRDQVKFVICDRGDYRWARQVLNVHRLAERCEVLFSPCWGRQDPAELAQWILDDRLPVRFQLQLHKLLWGEAPGR
jgi:7-carboxy-7-deazaguanine synthase